MPKKKEVKKVEVDRIVFIENIRNQIKLAQKIIKEFAELYGQIVDDEPKYNLKYYFVGDGMFYERTQKKKIGF